MTANLVENEASASKQLETDPLGGMVVQERFFLHPSANCSTAPDEHDGLHDPGAGFF